MGNLTFAEVYESDWSAYYWPISELMAIRSSATTGALSLVAAGHETVTPAMLPAKGLIIESKEQLLTELARLKELESFTNEALSSGEIAGNPLKESEREALETVHRELMNNRHMDTSSNLTRAEAIERWIAAVTPENESLMRFLGAHAQLHHQTVEECLSNASLIGGVTSYVDEIRAYFSERFQGQRSAEEATGVTQADLLSRLLAGDHSIELAHDFEKLFRVMLPIDLESMMKSSRRYRPMAYQTKFYAAFIEAMLSELDMIVIETEVRLS